jgi:hypothetical protein
MKACRECRRGREYNLAECIREMTVWQPWGLIYKSTAVGEIEREREREGIAVPAFLLHNKMSTSIL